jgi:hypothetical protein
MAVVLCEWRCWEWWQMWTASFRTGDCAWQAGRLVYMVVKALNGWAG